VFGGIPAHKLLQQMITARLANVTVYFSMYGTPDGCDHVLHAIEQRQPPLTVAETWALLKTLNQSGWGWGRGKDVVKQILVGLAPPQPVAEGDEGKNEAEEDDAPGDKPQNGGCNV